MSAPAVVSSRRISAGIRPEPGAMSRLPAWWGAEDWLGEVAAALTPDVCRDHHVSADAALAVARGMAAHADYRTGRDCRPTNERLVELVRVSLSTVQRARRALKSLGLVVELVRGRSIMSRAERLQAWRRGSSHRMVAAEFALCSRARRAPRISSPEVGDGGSSVGADLQSVDGDTPPGAYRGTSVSHLRRTTLRRRTEKSEEAAPRLAPTSGSGTAAAGPRDGSPRAGRDGSGLHPGTAALAGAAARRVGWLAGVSPRRITPTLSRFARAGWTGRDVELAVREVLTRRGWRVPRTLTQPAAYLAGLLRELDPADRPTAWEERQRQLDRAEDAYRLQLATGAPCEHGTPAGNVPSPTRRLLACPACRRAAAGS